jgi:8-oxo-dGTP pyrophosphatase MutT (NUDIX family)
MTTINELKIIEYTTTVLHGPSNMTTEKVWISKRINPEKEFYNYYQTPGGHVEKTDVSAKHAAQREVLEETGIHLDLKELKYWRTEHYFREDKEWRIVHCYKARTGEKPKLTEPEEMTEWKLKEFKKLIGKPLIDSVRDTLKKKQQVETRIIVVEGTCKVGKTTFVKKCKEQLKKQKLSVEIINETFITQDLEKRMIKYGDSIEKYRNNEITKEQMRERQLNLKNG